jgi:hypothetical protein
MATRRHKRNGADGQEMPKGAPGLVEVSRTTRSRITNGNQLLPSVDGRSIWARLFRDTYAALVAHCGGPDCVSETMRATARRAAAIEAELVHLEDSFALARQNDRAPPTNDLDLYGRLADRQRRLHEVLGWSRGSRDISPASGPRTIDMTDNIIDALRETAL